jgi:hypothetical protein
MLNRVVEVIGWLSGPASTPLATKATGWPLCTAKITPEKASRSALEARQELTPSAAAARVVGAAAARVVGVAAQAAVLIATSNLADGARARRVELFPVISFSFED